MRKKENKETRKKRQEMAVAIWAKMTAEEKEKEIETRKAQAAEKRTSILSKESEKMTMLKEGRAFVHLNKINTFCWEFPGDYHIFAGALLKTGPNNTRYYLVAYAICSPKDSLSKPIGKGYVGIRLKRENHPYKFEIMLAKRGTLSRKRLNALCYAHILMDIVAKRVQVPGALEHRCVRNLYGRNEVA